MVVCKILWHFFAENPIARSSRLLKKINYRYILSIAEIITINLFWPVFHISLRTLLWHMCLHTRTLTGDQPYLVGRQEVLAGSTAGHNGTGSHTKMWARKREICEVGLVQRRRAGRAHVEPAVCVYCAPCHMLHGKFHPETHCCWGVECWSHWRGFPSPPIRSLIPHLLPRAISYALKNKKLLQSVFGSSGPCN